ncbi:hypothetical protein [Micromonospora sp. NPDC050200]|uniref:hypothetical protein n=1 Tax=Micromonospora sp. NPDC050200 TaxID=3155664 RepID=UPI0033CFDB17
MVDLAWGLGAGVAGAAGVMLLYRALAAGTMGRGRTGHGDHRRGGADRRRAADGSLAYPASTVLLALAVDRERLRPVQLAGLGFAAGALVLASV